MSDHGLLIFEDISCEKAFLELAKRLGTPVALRDGSYIKTLKIIDKHCAPRRSLSSKYGAGMFPFHTDTAFWNLPARLVLIRAVSGDLRRSTFVKEFRYLFEDIGSLTLNNSAWICDTGTRKFYTTLRFVADENYGYRFDSNCMSAANRSSCQIEEKLMQRCNKLDGQEIKWAPGRVAVIPNWKYLHARGFPCDEEKERVLQRIYIQ